MTTPREAVKYKHSSGLTHSCVWGGTNRDYTPQAIICRQRRAAWGALAHTPTPHALVPRCRHLELRFPIHQPALSNDKAGKIALALRQSAGRGRMEASGWRR